MEVRKKTVLRSALCGGAILAALVLAAGVTPARAADPDYKGWFVALDLANTQPNSLDHHYANNTVFPLTGPVTTERLTLDNDADFTAKISVGYGFGAKGKLMVSWWGFDNEDDFEDTLPGGVYPTIFGYGPSGGMYAYNPAGVSFSTSAKVQASTFDVDYIRSFSPSEGMTIGWLAGLRMASWEEDQAFEAADGYANYYSQGKHFESDGMGFRLGAKLHWGFTEHFGMGGSAVWSFLQADTEGNSFQRFAVSGTPDDTNEATDDNIRGEIRDYDLKAVWTYGALDFWVGYSMSNWSGMPTDPVPGNEGGHFAAGPITSRGREDVAFNSLHAGVAWKFGGGK